MERPVDDPLLWHCLPPQELPAAMALVQGLLGGHPHQLTLLVGERTRLVLPPAVARALLDIASLLACREGASILVVDKFQEISPAQAGEVLRVSETVVRQLCQSGQLAYRRVGRNRRIGLASIISYQSGAGGQVAGLEEEFIKLAENAQSPLATTDEKRKSKPGAHRKKPQVSSPPENLPRLPVAVDGPTGLRKRTAAKVPLPDT